MKVKCIILILVISTIDILAGFDIIQRSHSDYYDITSIYKKQSEYNRKGCEHNVFTNYSIYHNTCYDVEVYLKTNAIGMPLEFNGLILSSNKNSLEFRADEAYPSNIITDNIVEYDVDEWKITKLSMSNPYGISSLFYYNLLLWNSDNSEGSFKIKWQQENTIQTCISISYLLEDNSKCTLSMEIINENNSNGTILSYDFQQTKELETVLFKSNDLLLKNITYSLNLKLQKIGKVVFEYVYDYRYEKKVTKTMYPSDCKIGIKRIAQCAYEYENEELYTMTIKDIHQKPDGKQAFGVYPFGTMPLLPNKYEYTSSKCLNGGFLYMNKCVCPPGFKGNFCEYVCGPNTFGVDCSGMCSMHQTGCREMVFCTKGFGCQCPPGFKSDNCETKCMKGTYGANCAERCSKSCNSEICDIYTGRCTKGCKRNYIPPDCVEKYPWLKEPPPKLESSDFYSIKLKLNFDPENISGSRTISPVYYQIIYKLANNESEYQYTKLKEIKQHKSVIEIIDNLKPEISYSFGVILVTEDGNANFDDIKTVNYSTLCRLTKDIDYGVNLLSGTDHINVTWNKHDNQNEDECKITGYLVKLMFNGTDIKQKSYSEEIIYNNNNNNNKNNNGYTFENLLSNQKYAVEITAISSVGQATQSEISYISTRPYGFVKIQNIKAEFLNHQSSMVITWDTDDKYKIPMIFIVKYKINKHFSCSHEIVNSNWTSLLVYNHTKREISDIIPNTQYIIQVVPTIEGHNYKDHENILYVKTPNSTPKLTPVIIENSTYVTNQTAYFNWTINKKECLKLNGLFLGYRVVLKTILEDVEKINITEIGTIHYDGFDTALKPETKYKLQVYVITNYGYNSEQVLSIPFQTKSKLLEPVDGLTVYRKNLKRKSIGIRWSFPADEYNVDDFIITVINDQTGFSRQAIVEPEKCVAWPTFYCATFENLMPNIQYTIKVKAKSLDYPTGGRTASVVSNFNDGFSDKPENLKATNVSSTHITLEWDIPWMINGVLKSFIINTEEISSKDMDKCCESKPDVEIQVYEEMPTYSYTIYDLKPGSTYSIGVLSKTSLYGQTNRILVTTLSATPAEYEANTYRPNSTTEINI